LILVREAAYVPAVLTATATAAAAAAVGAITVSERGGQAAGDKLVRMYIYIYIVAHVRMSACP
jgi:hypothetical protein